MDDLISRQAVTKFLNDWLSCLFENCHKQSASDLKMIIKDFKNLPSAQSEHPSEIQDILDYLDTALHPFISPEYWNVYSELYDMISTLPSAERHGRWEFIGGYGYQYRCSVCLTCAERKEKFCPNCGAKMEEYK